MRRLQTRIKRQTGAVAVIVAISIVVIIGMVGLALDLGKLFITKSELQNSADACALAAARELTGVSDTQLTIAQAAGITVSSANSVIFQSEPVTSVSISFSDNVNGPYQSTFEGALARNMQYVRCQATRAGIANWFIQVLNILPGTNIGPQSVSSTAVASLTRAQNNCAIPIGICEEDLAAAGYKNGTWLEGALSDGITGSFKWVDFSPPAGGASELADLLKGAGQCDIPATGAEVGESGYVASLADTWNSRFGIYKNKPTQQGATPDYTGYAYTEVTSSWPSKFNAFPDFANRRDANDPYQGNALTGLNVKGSIDSTSELQANGSDRRIANVPVVRCSDFVSSQTVEIRDWACILMLHPINDNASKKNKKNKKNKKKSVRMYLEYLGLASDLGSPCATLGIPGGSTSIGPQVPVLVK